MAGWTLKSPGSNICLVSIAHDVSHIPVPTVMRRGRQYKLDIKTNRDTKITLEFFLHKK